MSWKYNWDDKIEMSLVGTGSDTWVAFGFTSFAGMKNSDIYYCINSTSSNSSTLSVASAFAPSESKIF